MRVYACHKPTGITCDLSVRSTARGRRFQDLKSWFDALAPGLRHVGRLDKPTTGLLIAITSDDVGAGKLTRRLLDPGAVAKTYIARVKCGTTASTSTHGGGPDARRQGPDPDQLERLRGGVSLPDGIAKFDTVEIDSHHQRTFKKNGTTYTTHETELRLTIRIGKNRIVRRLLAAVGLPVVCLARIAIGRLRIEDLSIPLPFDSVQLTPNQINLLTQEPRAKRERGVKEEDDSGKPRYKRRLR